jgi:hypothetical protein
MLPVSLNHPFLIAPIYYLYITIMDDQNRPPKKPRVNPAKEQSEPSERAVPVSNKNLVSDRGKKKYTKRGKIRYHVDSRYKNEDLRI